ncbi:MAG: U32 family peptidase [Actinobacteria bacterium]|nr:U32 family peptidase [Actinomycetota bacterium]
MANLAKNSERKAKIPELLVPANNLNTLKYAVEYGADAVYVGGEKFNLRILGKNFTIEELEEAVEYAHSRNVKVYFTLNSFIFDQELDELSEYLEKIRYIKFDGIIVSDFGVFELLKEKFPDAKVHISTQANVTNHIGVKFWEKAGASRVNIAREVKFEDLKSIIENSSIEIEIFVHGALCISYSGRCMLSKYMTGRDANRGECAHSCRWKYYLMEEKRPNLFFQIEQDKRGTYIYNSRDLCLLPKLDLLVDIGIDSFKIEGRNKTENYVSVTTWVYREALNAIMKGNFTPQKISYLMNELDKISHRDFTLGFMFLDDWRELCENDGVRYIRKYRFVGVYHSFSKEHDGPVIKVKNNFKVGDILDILQPYAYPKKFILKKLFLYEDKSEISCANPNDLVIISGLGRVNPFSIFRVKDD